MMESSRSVFFQNLAELTDIDIDMEVKSEQESDEEIICNDKVFGDCCGFDVEFIIPERRKPDEIVPEVQPDNIVSNLSQDDFEDLATSTCDSDEEVEDEPEVEIDEVTVQQELVEVTLDPSLLLYVKRDKKPEQPKRDQQSGVCNSVGCLKTPFDKAGQIFESEKTLFDINALPNSVFSNQDDLFSSFPIPNVQSRSSSVTAALRKVKRKPHREPLEPLNEIECSSNIDNSRNSESNKLIPDEQNGNIDGVDKFVMNYNGYDSDNNDKDVLCDQQSVSGSDSESKEQREVLINYPVLTKRRRGRPRLKPPDFLNRIHTKRKGKSRKVRKKAKVKHKSNKLRKNHLSKENLIKEDHVTLESRSHTTETTCDKAREASEIDILNGVRSENSKDISACENSLYENQKKERKTKKEKKKPTIFDEVKMEYTILNENEMKEKPKRIRKRDKKSRELAALSKPESFDCTECGRKFKEKSHLATHARAHINIRNFKCNRCSNLFKTKTSLFFHMKTHSDTPFTCEKCNKTYPERRMLMRHIRVVHSSQSLYSCDQCGREFKSMNNLNLHYTLHTGAKPFTCNKCGKSFVYKSTYIAHMKGHDADNSFNCELCPKTFNSKAEFRRLCNHHSEARPWLCTVCGKGYPLKGTLKNHMKTHEPEKPFKCPDCPKSFMKKQSFECHLKIHAGESPQFMCDQCSQSYFNVFALKRHYLKHTSERKFVCEVCSKAFWMKDALKVHMRTHSNVKMFPCSQCPKAFAHKHTLDAHLRTHLDVQPYSCNVCQKTFIHKYNLARHERQHLLANSIAVMPLSMPMIPPGPQPMPISMMMLPPLSPSPTSTSLHVL